MKRRFSLTPTTVATFFTLAALGIPCAAWYLTGSRVVEQEAERLRRTPRVRAQQEARRIADRLSTRLEALRLSETRRSFLDYNPQPHSPLAEGPADPMIWAHFQMDERGTLTLPTLAPGPGAQHDNQALQAQQAILETLECALTKPLSSFPANVEGGSTQRYVGPDGTVEATVGTLRWETIELEGQPALIAARTVRLPTATLSQGFAVRPDGLRAYVGDAPSPASVRPGAPDGPTQARIPIVGVTWTVVVDGTAEAAEADRLAAQIVSRFRKTFAGGLFAALFAGGLVVSLVWQSERLASQRARFAASAAHELRTPLAGLRMYGEMLADGAGEPERGRRYARRIAGEAERLGRVVSNLLGFSRLERGELVFDSTPGELCATVRESVDQLRPALEASGARIETNIETGLPEVCFNRDAVHQILQNLLDNAEKYGRSAEDRTIRVEVASNGNGVRLAVVDHGPGLDPALRRSLFRPFVRNTAPDAPAGLGLGLAIVEALARSQKATVAYSPEPGGGSRFTVAFAC